MGLKDSVAKAIPVVFVKETPKITEKLVVDSYVAALSDVTEEIKKEKAVPRPKTTYVASQGIRKTCESFICESCGTLDICIEFDKLLLCETTCAPKEVEALKNATPVEAFKPEPHPAVIASIARLNPEHYEKTLAQDDTPLYAKGREELYYEFFNRDYNIANMTDEQLRDSIIADGAVLFEVKVKQQKKIISLKERLAKRTEKEREKFRLDDLEYKPNLEEESIFSKPKKSAKDKAIDSLKGLGLDADDMKNLLAKFAKK